MTIWFGRPGDPIQLEHPRGGVRLTRDRPSAVFRTGSGGARVGQAIGGKREYQLNWQRLWYETYAALEGYYHGHEGPGPFALHDPGRPNWLTVNQSGATSQTNDPTGFSAWEADGLNLSATASGSNAWTNDNATLGGTGDMSMRAEADPITWANEVDGQCLVGQWSDILTTQRSRLLGVGANGIPFLVWSSTGSNVLFRPCTVALAADAGPFALRADLDVDDGAGNHVVTFYISDSIGGTWRQLGSAVTTVGTTTVFNSNLPLEVGAHSSGAHDIFRGVIRAAEVYVGGVLAANPRFDRQRPNTLTLTDSVSNLWTLRGSAAITGDYDGADNLSSSASAFHRGPRSLRWDVFSDNAAAAASGSVIDSLKILPASPSWPGIPVVPGQAICLSFWRKANAGGPVATLTPRLQWLDAAGAVLSTTTGTPTAPSTSWLQQQVTGTPPVGATYVLCWVDATDSLASPVGTTVVWLDEFQLEFGAAPGTWRPGTGIYPLAVTGLTEEWPWRAELYRENAVLTLQEAGPG